ncbi:cocaine- and amphetamine-regulated transcript protein-like isoform X2 [Stegostoma tigrinum]|uniref:cocaine- and amphetamine-regulated transcript protein-like isoform X2 n=1 Tax=Stegostoma tigrinum TaxID=3053191 RepID=UPI00286FCCB5|nr:cocaine- and amphetamine-regulated transcript protein-like isoform X2 [Stegostoma tigrinum]
MLLYKSWAPDGEAERCETTQVYFGVCSLFSTMESDRIFAAVYLSILLSLASGSDSSDLETRALRDFYPKNSYPSSEKELLGALQEVLEKLQTKRLPAWEKKFGQVPLLILHNGIFCIH